MNTATQEKHRGSWRIEGDILCYHYYRNQPSADICVRVYGGSDSQYTFFNAAGGRPFSGVVTLVAGNPHKL
jgi:hypothetical protein